MESHAFHAALSGPEAPRNVALIGAWWAAAAPDDTAIGLSPPPSQLLRSALVHVDRFQATGGALFGPSGSARL